MTTSQPSSLSFYLSLCVALSIEGDVHLEHRRLRGIKNCWRASACTRPPTKAEKKLGWKERFWDTWYNGATPEEAVYKLYKSLKRQRKE